LPWEKRNRENRDDELTLCVLERRLTTGSSGEKKSSFKIEKKGEDTEERVKTAGEAKGSRQKKKL